nr:MAG TPA: hypothetical protein [Caudoviricetes sp.]
MGILEKLKILLRLISFILFFAVAIKVGDVLGNYLLRILKIMLKRRQLLI